MYHCTYSIKSRALNQKNSDSKSLDTKTPLYAILGLIPQWNDQWNCRVGHWFGLGVHFQSKVGNHATIFEEGRGLDMPPSLETSLHYIAHLWVNLLSWFGAINVTLSQVCTAQEIWQGSDRFFSLKGGWGQGTRLDVWWCYHSNTCRFSWTILK